MASRRNSNSEIASSFDEQNDAAICCTGECSPKKTIEIKRIRAPLEDCDPNKHNVSFKIPDKKNRNGFEFVEPHGVAPRRQSIDSRSPVQSPVRVSPQRPRDSRQSFFRSLSSGYESMDDCLNDLVDLDSFEEATQLPNGISNLLSGDIVSDVDAHHEVAATVERNETIPQSEKLTYIRRSLSIESIRSNEDESSFKSSRIRSCLFRSPNATSSATKLSFDSNPRKQLFADSHSTPSNHFEQSELTKEFTPKLIQKRSRKVKSFQVTSDASPPSKPSPIPRCHSETETHVSIKSAIHRSITDDHLTGDFSKPCVLPLACGIHEDLKSISAETLASLMKGNFSDCISSFKIVDCRYPYEFEGGHITGAINLYNKDLIEQNLLEPMQHTPKIEPDLDKRQILIFHCEFSYERGPALSRFLRSLDRNRNKEHYPALHYPEIYLLHGGYEVFYKEFMNLCSPRGYKKMRDPEHESELKLFRSKSKSWQGEKSRINGISSRTTLKRLGF